MQRQSDRPSGRTYDRYTEVGDRGHLLPLGTRQHVNVRWMSEGMSDSVPEYYRHLTEKSGEKSGPEQGADPKEDSGDEETDSQEAPSKPTVHRADASRLLCPEGEWQDGSVYTIIGPTIDGVTHNITVTTDDDVEADSVYDFAAQEIALLEPQLDGCHVLIDDSIEVDCGDPAYRAIFVWTPEDDMKLYQEQIYALPDGRGYTLTASFTRATRKQLGAEVERMMLSFTPTEEGRPVGTDEPSWTRQEKGGNS